MMTDERTGQERVEADAERRAARMLARAIPPVRSARKILTDAGMPVPLWMDQLAEAYMNGARTRALLRD